MRKFLKARLARLKYRQEATVVCLALLAALGAALTLGMCFFSLNRALLLLIITLLLTAALFLYRARTQRPLRASISTLRNAHALRKKRKG